MIKFLVQQRLEEKIKAEGRNIRLAEVAEAIGVSRQVLVNLATSHPRTVTNTAHLEALCRYFKCGWDKIAVLEPPATADEPCHIDKLYPGRRKKP